MIHLCLPILFLTTSVTAAETIASGKYKQVEQQYIEQINTAKDAVAKSKLKKKLAEVYLKDQNQALAFKTFLEALEDLPKNEAPISDKEKHVYEQAFKYYIDQNGTPQEVASQLREEYAIVLAQHPDFHRLGLLVAGAYANLGYYDEFFDLFYKAYPYDTENFISYKTKALLHIKLFDRLYKPEEREAERLKVVHYLHEAAKLYPQDTTLYKMEIAFSPVAEKKDILERNLKKIVDGNMMVPRHDIGFYVDQALAFNQVEIAQAFVDRAKEWYPYSRAINAAQEILDRKKGK